MIVTYPVLHLVTPTLKQQSTTSFVCLSYCNIATSKLTKKTGVVFEFARLKSGQLQHMGNIAWGNVLTCITGRPKTVLKVKCMHGLSQIRQLLRQPCVSGTSCFTACVMDIWTQQCYNDISILLINYTSSDYLCQCQSWIYIAQSHEASLMRCVHYSEITPK